MKYNKVLAQLGEFKVFNTRIFRIQIPTLGAMQFITTALSFDENKEYIEFGKGDNSGTEGTFKLSRIKDIYTLSDPTYGKITNIIIK